MAEGASPDSRISGKSIAGGGCVTSDVWAKVSRADIREVNKQMTTLTTALAIGLISIQNPPNLEADLEIGLGTVGLNTKTARFEPTFLEFFRQGEFSTPTYRALFNDPWRATFVSEMWRKQFSSLVGKPSESLATAGRMVGMGARRTLLGDPIQGATEAASKPGALLKVLNEMKARGLIRSEIPAVDKIPGPVQNAAALVITVALDRVRFRRAALSKVEDPATAYDMVTHARPDDDPDAMSRFRKLYQNFDPSTMAAGAHDIALAATTARTICGAVSPSENYSYSINTDWGLILLGGAGDTIYSQKETFLIIDTSGNDTYLGLPANHSVNNWCSVVIDTAGDDHYLSDAALAKTTIASWADRKKNRDTPGPASASLGISVLVDAAGNDVYRSHRPGLASSNLGVSVLFDASGDDTYDAYADAIGCATFGVALLEDVSGNDKYNGFTQTQGVGLTGGAGILIDRAGDDTYVADDQTIDFPSPQSSEHNVSMSQGAGNGRRADYLDGHSLSGGVGILYDQAGKDTYTCGVFGQGVGYWEGVGMLWDAEGDDVYSGQWYVQGAAAHFAIGLLDDSAGDDRYNAGMNMALGAGHDFSIGYLFDRGGADAYQAPNLSLGAGNANGIGWFLDVSGNDVYASSGITLGKAAEAPKGTLRERCLCFGLFMDLGGSDTFPASIPWAKNATRQANITDRNFTPQESQLGVFWDR